MARRDGTQMIETRSRVVAIALQVNGKPVEARVEPTMLLLDFLRDGLGLTGTHQGCDTAQCGACTVLVDGAATKSCNVLALQVQGQDIDTIEGLQSTVGADKANKSVSTLHPMQEAFGRHHGLQCGYCTPGMVMRGVAMASEDVPAEPAAVRNALAGNICRCTGYYGIVAAICEGMQTMRAGVEGADLQDAPGKAAS
ncbi:MAG: (2Fe-2S)-binding protein [Variovorax sp.]